MNDALTVRLVHRERRLSEHVGDEAERERLREAGRRRAAGFTWERTAELTAASYSLTLGGQSN